MSCGNINTGQRLGFIDSTRSAALTSGAARGSTVKSKPHVKLMLLTCLFFQCATSFCYAQKCVVTNTKMNVIYYGLLNPLDVAVESYKCKDVSIETDNGTISPTENNCSYLISADKVGIANITVKEKKTGKRLGIISFRVRQIPGPVAKVAGKQGGNIGKNLLRAQLGVGAYLDGFDIDVRCVITQFTVTILRNGSGIFAYTSEGALFSPEIMEAFASLTLNDKVIFSNLTYKCPFNSGNISPIELTIVEDK